MPLEISTMTAEHTARRTLVKSAPELWAECSVADSLARHLGQFGEIKITRLEPETTVAWEGTRASGTVRLEPSGWGTQVTLTAVAEVVEVGEPEPGREVLGEPQPEVLIEPEPDVLGEPEPNVVVDPGTAVVVEPEPVAVADPAAVAVVDPAPVAVADPAPVAAVEREPVTVARPEPIRTSKRRFRDRLRRFFNGPQPQPQPQPQPKREVEPEPVARPAPDPELLSPPAPDPEPMAQPEPEPKSVDEPAPHPEPMAQPESEPESGVVADGEPALDPRSLLVAALDSLGQAHHRPFSRA